MLYVYSHVKHSAHVQLHMALHVAVLLFYFYFFLHNHLVRIIEGPDDRGADNRGSTVVDISTFRLKT